jgi:hypothetical protein
MSENDFSKIVSGKDVRAFWFLLNHSIELKHDFKRFSIKMPIKRKNID